MMKNFYIVEHPLLMHYLTVLRDKNTRQEQFKYTLDKVSYLLASHVYADLTVTQKVINTPLKKCNGASVNNLVVLMPILRAGLGLLTGFVDLYPTAIISHMGLYRDEELLKPVKYYFKFPKIKNKELLRVIILDPMIATGGSISFAIEYLLNMGIPRISVASLLTAPEGLEAIENRFNKLEKNKLFIYTCALDEGLNEKGYIIPGLGDAGDRLFGT
jgi:uracil phosphoribosyltransferase